MFWNVSVAKYLAMAFHEGDTDKSGKPLIEHVAGVAELVGQDGGTEHQVMAAWLHDTVEDTPLTLDDLVRWGCPADVVRMVADLTHWKGETREHYIGRMSAQARFIKRRDNKHNSGRLDDLEDEATKERLTVKYERDRLYLDLADSEEGVDTR